MKSYFFFLATFIVANLNAQFQFGLGSGYSKVASNFKIYDFNKPVEVLLDSSESKIAPSIFLDLHSKNFGMVATYSQHLFTATIDYSKIVIDDVMNLGLGAGVIINNWTNIQDNYYSNNRIQNHSAPLTDGYKTLCGVLTANCDIRLYRNLKTRISFSKNLGNIGYISQDNGDYKNAANDLIGKTEYFKKPTFSFAIYYSFEEKIKGQLILDPSPKRNIIID